MSIHYLDAQRKVPVLQVALPPRRQSRWLSLCESLLNIAIGYGVAVISQLVIFPLFNIHLPMADHLAISGWFTVISLVRSYLVRRLFNSF